MSPVGDPLSHFHAVILAGGRGTRFWPRSRRRLPKQLLPFIGEHSLLWHTVNRLEALVPPERVWVLTSEQLRRQITRQLPQVPRRQVIAEPVQRNTGPAIALAAHLLSEQDPDAVMGVFPSDHLIAHPSRFETLMRRAARAAQQDQLIVFGISPKWPETGYGYIEYPKGTKPGNTRSVAVVSFREKPQLAQARRFVKAGHFYWNSGMFAWRARTIGAAVKRFMPSTAQAISQVKPVSSRLFTRSLREHYSHCENISIDYGVLERAETIAGFACPDLGWSDLGSWEAVYQLLPKDKSDNVARSPVVFQASLGNYVDAPGKVVALVGVENMIVVDTPDALLVCPRSEAQAISALVKALEKTGMDPLL